jgi:superfamily II RNA helicase
MHHSGILPPLREMVELLFSKGLVQLLICTETMSIGINMPVKTVLFTDVVKFDGNGLRQIESHEYTQMAGRAGRLGLDTVGHVIHLNNLWKPVDLLSYKNMLQGKPPTLVSKFKLSPAFVLNQIKMGDYDFTKVAEKSMIQGELNKTRETVEQEMGELNKEIERLESHIEDLTTPRPVVEAYLLLQEELSRPLAQKKKKELESKRDELLFEQKMLRIDAQTMIRLQEKRKQLQERQENLLVVETFLQKEIDSILRFLEETGMVSGDPFLLTKRGDIATQWKEVPCLVFSSFMDHSEDKVHTMTTCHWIALFSCFTNVTVQEEYRDLRPKTRDPLLKEVLETVKESIEYYESKEEEYGIISGTEYAMHFDLLDFSIMWAEANSAEECKYVLQVAEQEKGIFTGEFVKALLKINNIANEMEVIAEGIENLPLLQKMTEIKEKTLKFIATNQSLYI